MEADVYFTVIVVFVFGDRDNSLWKTEVEDGEILSIRFMCVSFLIMRVNTGHVIFIPRHSKNHK